MIYKRIDKILVPLDGSKNSQRGLEMAIGIARQCEATLMGVVSIETPPHSEFKGVGSVSKQVSKEVKKSWMKPKCFRQKTALSSNQKLCMEILATILSKLPTQKRKI